MESLRLERLLPKKASKRSPKPGKPSRRAARPEKKQEQDWLSGLDPETKAEILRSLISREELYNEVWAEPVTKVAERYGASDVAVAKWCRKMNVPRPGRGYWARKSAGQRMKRAPLPEARKGHRRYVDRPKPSEKKPDSSTGIPGLKLFQKPILVEEKTDTEHPLVAATRRALECGSTDEYGIIRRQDQESLAVFVSPANVDRSLRIMNTLIRALEDAGFAVEVQPTLNSEGHPTGFTTIAEIYGELIPLHIAEEIDRAERAPTHDERMEMRQSWRVRGPFYSYSPTGELTFQVDGDWYQERHRRKWTDGKPRPLEECIYPFVRSLLISADARRRSHEGAEE